MCEYTYVYVCVYVCVCVCASVCVPYSGKVWQGETLVNLLLLSIWQKKVWRMNRSANRLSIVTTNLDGFSLANHGRFVKFAKLSPCQTFSLPNFLAIRYVFV